MKQKTRNGILREQADSQERVLSFLYGTTAGRLLLKPLTAPWISRAAGSFLSCGLSRPLIKPFIKKNNIDMEQFEDITYPNYNEFFSRKIRPGARTVDMEASHLISPADSKLTVLPVTKEGRFTLKHTEYTLTSLLRDEKLAAEFEGGSVLIFRLTVDDYHRYCYIADGEQLYSKRIQGVLHTVNPIANDHYPIYKENCREYCLLRSDVFGDMVMMEVGALLVGKIVNHHEKGPVLRGQEKGYFQFGGSTVVLLIKANTIRIDSDILQNSAEGIETVVKYGEKIAARL